MIIYIDSLYMQPHQNWINRLCAFINQFLVVEWRDWNEWQVSNIPSDIPSQRLEDAESTNNCVINVCSWIRAICLKNNNPFREQDMNTARKALASALFNYISTKRFNNKNVNLRNLLLDAEIGIIRPHNRLFENLFD